MTGTTPALLFDAASVDSPRGVTLLHTVNLEVPQRGLFGIVGPNGAGKSSLLRAVLGLLPLKSGQLSICGRPHDSWRADELARHIGYVPQKVHSHWDLRVDEILQLAGSQLDPKLYCRLELAPLLHRAFNALSGGEQARVAIARALAHHPALLLADEPAAHLDLPHQHDLMQQLHELSATRAIVIVLHDFHLASRYCSKVALLNKGTIQHCGPPEQVLSAASLSEVYGKQIEVIGDTAEETFFTLARQPTALLSH